MDCKKNADLIIFDMNINKILKFPHLKIIRINFKDVVLRLVKIKLIAKADFISKVGFGICIKLFLFKLMLSSPFLSLQIDELSLVPYYLCVLSSQSDLLWFDDRSLHKKAYRWHPFFYIAYL